MEEENITPEQTEKLIQFQDLTGIEDMSQCKDLLQRNNWDLEVSVQQHLGEHVFGEMPEDAIHANGVVPHHDRLGDGVQRRLFPSPRLPVREPVVNAHPIDQRVFSYRQRREPVGLFGWTSFLLSLPFRIFYSAIYDILFFVYRLFRPDPRLMVTDPLGDVMQLVNSYDAKYGPVHPVFYQGTYAQALNDAKQELTFLVVYLHSDNNSDCDVFCRGTLADDGVIALLNARTLFWVCAVETAEGYRVSRALQRGLSAVTFPFVAMIVFRETRMSVVARFEGPVDATSFAQRLARVMDDNETALEVVRADRRERTNAQHLRQEQDAAYLESLLMDQEKERRKKEEEEERRREEVASLLRAEDERRAAESVVRLKTLLLDALPPEPAVDDPDAVRILLKCPSGLRLERRFRKTQSIEDLFIYIYCNQDTPDDFSIVKNFPRVEIPGKPPTLQEYKHLLDESEPPFNLATSPTFAEVGLSNSEMLFVQDNQA